MSDLSSTPGGNQPPDPPDPPNGGADAQPGAGTATATAEPPPAPPPPGLPPTLVRPTGDRMFRGVCAAIGRATGTDPVLWRVLVVVLAFFGGSGVVLYLAGWLLIPEEGAPESEAQRLGRGHGMSTGATIALVALVVIAVLAVFGDGRGVVPLVVLGAVAYLVLRNGNGTAGGRTAPPGAATGAAAWTAPPAWSEPTGPAPGWTPPPGAPPGTWGPAPGPLLGPPPPPPPPRPTSNLGALTVSAAAVVVGALLLLAVVLGVSGITPTRVLAAALLVTGLGLVVGARWGRARGLIVLAVVLSLALGATSSVDRRYGSATGERTWEVTGSAEHRLAAGEARLDLRPLAGTARRGLSVEGRVGAGELVVLVPEDLRVRLVGHVGLGELTVVESDGSRAVEDGGGLRRDVSLGPEGARAVDLDVRVGIGELEVRRVAAQ